MIPEVLEVNRSFDMMDLEGINEREVHFTDILYWLSHRP